ncbi:aminodeoxychorismate lyase [Marinomonas algarum]|uniref:Aminodeoxychorismate lyase n=1 Tax=Marinomonas algarum TaxID=2883105 RepID=A0A9X1ILB0_9GAMM|nr:aminodeoxychorismate lyase [Marinomonas algarum]MCB5160371.1 aminodeoxychorismate lyase [Marinomonas algarum]
MTWFVNYQQNITVSPADRGLAYGDGVFETIRTFPLSFSELKFHLSRLYRGLNKLGMPFSAEQKQTLCDFLYQTVLPKIEHESVIKIIVTRGEGGRGYLPPINCEHMISVGILPAPDYNSQRQNGVALSLSPIPVSNNRFLAGMKHLNRLENVLAKQRLTVPYFESIMFDSHQHIVECIQSNIFWFKDGLLFTPSLISSGVQGTYRSAIISGQSQYCVQTGRFKLSALESADEVFITNSLMGIVPVTRIVDRSLPIGVHTLTLQKLMQKKDKHGAI